jgi:hypothetical protein
MIFGQAVHTLILEPQKFYGEWASPCFDDEGRRHSKSTKPGKTAWAAWEEKNAGKTILDLGSDVPRAWGTAHQMQRAIMQQEVPRKIIADRGPAECAIVWQHAETGLWCKALIDKIELDRPPVTHLWDLKTTQSAHPRRFAYQAADLGYHFQAGFYTMGAFTLTQVQRRFGFICVEKKEPFVVKAWICKDSVIQQGQIEAEHALRLWARCLDQDRWPAYGNDIDEFNLPEWAYKEMPR